MLQTYKLYYYSNYNWLDNSFAISKRS